MGGAGVRVGATEGAWTFQCYSVFHVLILVSADCIVNICLLGHTLWALVGVLGGVGVSWMGQGWGLEPPKVPAAPPQP